MCLSFLDTVLQVVWHVANFVAPAFGMACVLSVLLRLRGAHAAKHALLRVWFTLFGLGVAVAVLGMALTNLDGTMLTYAALVLVTGSAAAWFARSGS